MILINASNLYVGGGMQVGISVIEELAKIEDEFIAAVSPPVFEQLSHNARKKCFVINKSPSGLFNFEARRQLDKFVVDYKILHVFTVFGPSYWSPKVDNHTVGFALPWLIYDTKLVFRKLSFLQKAKKMLLLQLQPYFYKKNAHKIIVETDDAKNLLSKKIGFSEDNIFVVPNTISSYFNCKRDHLSSKELDLKKTPGDIWLLTVSHNYPHKNLEIIHQLINILPERYKFVLTLDDSFLESVDKKFWHRFILLGKIKNSQCPEVYSHADGMFLPTLLECFSASYPEAGFMKVPIFTSDLSFAKTICGDGAFYFDPMDCKNIASVITSAYKNPDKIKEKIEIMYNIQSRLPSAVDRAVAYRDILLKKTH